MSRPNINTKQLETFRFIRNHLAQRGVSPSVRDVSNFFGYKSPRSAMLLINSLIKADLLERDEDTRELKILKDPEKEKFHAQTVEVPLVGCVACGQPLLAEENIKMAITVSTSIAKPPHKYFFLRATGDSMDLKGINDGDLVLVRQQPIADRGDVIVALIDNQATIKEFYPEKNAVVLKPASTNKEHKPIIVTNDFQIQGKVVSTLSNKII